MTFQVTITIITAILVISCNCCDNSYKIICRDNGYYWKDYNGNIPDDAFIAGSTKDGKNAYVGQVLRYYQSDSASNTGLVPVQIYPGVNSVTTYYGDGVKTYKQHIKILCGCQYRFKWVNTTTDSFSKDTANHNLVVGGKLYYTNYVGKLDQDQGDLRIGSVESGYLYPIYKTNYGKKSQYQVLTYIPQTSW